MENSLHKRMVMQGLQSALTWYFHGATANIQRHMRRHERLREVVEADDVPPALVAEPIPEAQLPGVDVVSGESALVYQEAETIAPDTNVVPENEPTPKNIISIDTEQKRLAKKRRGGWLGLLLSAPRQEWRRVNSRWQGGWFQGKALKFPYTVYILRKPEQGMSLDEQDQALLRAVSRYNEQAQIHSLFDLFRHHHKRIRMFIDTSKKGHPARFHGKEEDIDEFLYAQYKDLPRHFGYAYTQTFPENSYKLAEAWAIAARKRGYPTAVMESIGFEKPRPEVLVMMPVVSENMYKKFHAVEDKIFTEAVLSMDPDW